MTLIKCNHCGRPFYDSEKACPFCGHATSLSTGNRITKAISDTTSHKLMDDYFTGNLPHREIRPVHSAPVIKKEQTVAQPEPVVEEEPVVEPNPDVEPDSIVEHAPADESAPAQPSDAILNRAESIAAAVADNGEGASDTDDDEPEEIETTLPRKKRHVWAWLLILVILVGLAAAVYLKWDFVYGKVSNIFN